MKLRKDRYQKRQIAADDRQTKYDELTTMEKIAKLDATLGAGIGAKRQRARLLALLK